MTPALPIALAGSSSLTFFLVFMPSESYFGRGGQEPASTGLWEVTDRVECSADNIGTKREWTIPLECSENGWQEAELECTAENEGATRVIPSVGHEICQGGEWVLEIMPKEFQSRKLP